MRYKKQVFRSLAMVTQLGISVMTPVFLCIFVGCWVDTHFTTKTLLFFVIIGILAGGRCGWQMVKMTLAAGEKDDRQEKEAEEERRRRRDKPAVSRPKQPSRVLGRDEAGRSLTGVSLKESLPETGGGPGKDEQKGGTDRLDG